MKILLWSQLWSHRLGYFQNNFKLKPHGGHPLRHYLYFGRGLGHYLVSESSPKGKVPRGLEQFFNGKPTLNLELVSFTSDVGALKNPLLWSYQLFSNRIQCTDSIML